MQTSTRREKHVWFPVDEQGEPDNKNPDDGFGGFLHHLEKVIYYFVTCDGNLPSPDGCNILEGYAARNKAKENQIGKDWQRTSDLIYREFSLPIESGGCDDRWDILEERIYLLEEPDFCLIGQLWRTLYGEEKRPEEKELEKMERKEKKKTYIKNLPVDIIKVFIPDITFRKKMEFVNSPPKTPISRKKPCKYKEFPRRYNQRKR